MFATLFCEILTYFTNRWLYTLGGARDSFFTEKCYPLSSEVLNVLTGDCMLWARLETVFIWNSSILLTRFPLKIETRRNGENIADLVWFIDLNFIQITEP